MVDSGAKDAAIRHAAQCAPPSCPCIVRRQALRCAVVDPEDSREHLQELLANSLARLERFIDLNTVDVIIEHERRHARDLIAKLGPSDAHVVLHAWPRGAKLLEGDSSDSRSQRDETRPN